MCDVAAARWRAGKRILIACVDEAQATRIDEALWKRDPDSFVPHNLAGEGPRGGAPVEIAWPQKRGSSPREQALMGLVLDVTSPGSPHADADTSP